MRYRLIGIDLDGTLLGKDGRISAGNRAAIDRARAAGVLVAPCTGRSWIESHRIIAGLNGGSVGVFVSGAIVAELHTGRPLARTTLDPETALRVVRLLENEPDAVLVFRDGERAGHDYLVTGSGDVGENTRWWFSVTDVRVATKSVVEAADLAHTLRVSMVAPARRALALRDQLAGDLGDKVVVHSFEAVQLPARKESLHCLEVFAPEVDKWHGLLRIARPHAIGEDQIVAIGDEFNDLGMMRRAACRIAMGNASELIKSHAHHVTLDHDRDGVAHAIDNVLAGRWG